MSTPPVAVDLPEVGIPNVDIGGVVVKITESWIVAVVPMIYNDRVVLMRHHEWRTGWSAGWCYDKGGAAGLAAAVWDPETQWEPVGYKKLAGDAR